MWEDIFKAAPQVRGPLPTSAATNASGTHFIPIVPHRISPRDHGIQIEWTDGHKLLHLWTCSNHGGVGREKTGSRKKQSFSLLVSHLCELPTLLSALYTAYHYIVFLTTSLFPYAESSSLHTNNHNVFSDTERQCLSPSVHNHRTCSQLGNKLVPNWTMLLRLWLSK